MARPRPPLIFGERKITNEEDLKHVYNDHPDLIQQYIIGGQIERFFYGQGRDDLVELIKTKNDEKFTSSEIAQELAVKLGITYEVKEHIVITERLKEIAQQLEGDGKSIILKSGKWTQKVEITISKPKSITGVDENSSSFEIIQVNIDLKNDETFQISKISFKPAKTEGQTPHFNILNGTVTFNNVRFEGVCLKIKNKSMVILKNCQFENLEEAIIKDISAKIEGEDICSFLKCNKHVTETVDDETKKSVKNDVNEFIRQAQLQLIDELEFLKKISSTSFNKWEMCSREPVNMPETSFLLGMCFLEGIGVEKNPEKFLEYFRKASDSNYAPAQHILATLTEDTNEKMKLLEKSASQGYAPAQNALGIALKNTNKNLAREWLEKASAQEYALAQYNFAFLLEAGSEEEVNLFIKAANQGHEDAAYQIWDNYLNHKTDLKLDEAFAYLKKAAEAEHSTGEAEFSLGLYYLDTDDTQNAKKWFEKAKSNGQGYASQ